MKERQPIAKINFEMDKKHLEEIVSAGRLQHFINRAVGLFKLDLKAELVANSSSVSTSLALMDDFEFGSVGPRPPHWHNIERIQYLENRIATLEKITIGAQIETEKY